MRSLAVDGVSTDVAFAGQGVKVGLSVVVESEPRPVGETVFFFVGSDEAAARELSDQRAMEATFPDFEVSPDDIRAYGLPSDVAADEADLTSVEEEGELEREGAIADDQDEGAEDGRPLIVLKTDSGEGDRCHARLSVDDDRPHPGHAGRRH